VNRTAQFGTGIYLHAAVPDLSYTSQIAGREENKGKMIVTMFPNGGERYMHSDLFADVRDECSNMAF
jgi:cysteine synthase